MMPMICSNDNAEMHRVKIISHYGQPIFLEQCRKCGGIWFDESELYRAKPGEADKIELLDSEILREPSAIENSIHFCPIERAQLFRFTDKYFPSGIIVERCPKCDGFWLNRGEFSKFQEARWELLKPKEKTPEDKKLEEDIKQLFELHRTEGDNDTLKKLASFLSMPLDTDTMLPLESPEESSEGKKAFNLIMDILAVILRIFVFK